ncbi:MAG: HAMP domain-containing histidine kinase [Prevotella sp.]|nr:HAMP domain-containing histidine kinase [Prevotella sp.]
MRLKYLLLTLAVVTPTVATHADNKESYKESKEYVALRDSVHHAFNDSDSARFFASVGKLESYLLSQDDLHAYYTQRCNEIVFQLNRQRIFEAYKLATQLSKELTEKKLDKEMYMAINMMGHIYNYSGNKEGAKQCFWEVIRRMEQEGYTESQPPIYMNLVNIVMDEDPREGLRLIDQAASIAKKTSPERVFDIETRRTLAYYLLGDSQRFLDGYKAYREGVEKGFSSVHGRKLEVYYLASKGLVDEAARLALESGDDPFETQAEIYSGAGRWHEAYDALKKGVAETDSLNSLILSSSMQGIQGELKIYEAERRASRLWLYGLVAIVLLLSSLVVALVYIVQMRRRHLREMKQAYDRVLESDKLKTAFIQNVSHEVRTPLNVIAGFAQVLAATEYNISPQERQRIANTMMGSTRRITTMVDEVLEMSMNEVGTKEQNLSEVQANVTLRRIMEDFRREVGHLSTKFYFETTLDDDFMIWTNESVLRHVINPLLDNAVKNTESGEVRMVCGKTPDQLVIAIEDTGRGIPAEEAEHIFERFVKLDSFKEGMGLGLTICRSMASRLGGDVKLDTSYAGPGARFEVNLPLTYQEDNNK